MNRIHEIQERLNQILQEIETRSGEELAALETEQRNLIEELQNLQREAEARRRMTEQAASLGVTIETAPVDSEQQRTLDEVRASAEYAEAYVEALRTGNEQQLRTLLSDLVDGGTVPTPTSVQQAIETAWNDAVLASRAHIVSVPGTLKVPFELSATAASVHVEGAAAPAEETLTLGMVSIVPKMLKKWITISDEVVALKGNEFLAYINNEIGQRIAELADAEIVAAIKAAPETSAETAIGVPEVSVSKVDAATVFKALAKLSSAAKTPLIICHRATYFDTFMSLQDLQGRPIYNIVSDNGKPSYYINGLEVVFTDALTANTEFIVGDMDGVTVNLPEGQGIQYKYDDKSLMEKDLVKVLGRQYFGCGVTKPGYFVKVKAGA